MNDERKREVDEARIKSLRAGYRKWLADPEAGAARNASIITMRGGGATLAECGRLHGVSGMRVKQICDKAARKRDPES